MRAMTESEIEAVGGGKITRAEAANALVLGGGTGARAGAAAGAVVGGPIGAAAGAVIGAGLGIIAVALVHDMD
jgi:hypothetical protein